MNTTSQPRFTEAQLIIMLDCERDYLASLAKTSRNQRRRALSQARIDGYRRQLANRNFIAS